MTYDRDRLRAMLMQHSVRFGDFQLVSGQRSSVYVDAKLTTCKAEAMPLVGKAFLQKMKERGWKPQAVGGLTMGADPLAAAIARESLDSPQALDYFLIRKEPKKHGARKFLEGLAETAGVGVVILDDVCTTGGSTITAIEYARESGLNVLGAICLVDREMGAEDNILKLRCPFDRIFTLKDVVGDR